MQSKNLMMQHTIMKLNFRGLENCFVKKLEEPQKGLQFIQRHGLSKEMMSENVFCTSFRTNFFIPLKKITSSSLPLRISIENQIIGFKEQKILNHKWPLILRMIKRLHDGLNITYIYCSQLCIRIRLKGCMKLNLIAQR